MIIRGYWSEWSYFEFNSSNEKKVAQMIKDLSADFSQSSEELPEYYIVQKNGDLEYINSWPIDI